MEHKFFTFIQPFLSTGKGQFYRQPFGWLCVVMLCLGIGFSGCEEKEKVTLESIAVTTQPAKKTYMTGEAFDPAGMEVTATYSDKKTKAVTVTEAMLTYDFSSAGTNKEVTITYEGKTAKVSGITVNPAIVPVTGVSLNKTETTLTVGDSEMLTATITPEDATNQKVTWSSSNAALAIVDAEGTVTAIGEGEATITATTEDGGFEAKCKLTVTSDNDDDGLTEDVHNIIPEDILEKIKELGIVINGGINPPDIEGSYMVFPLTLVNSNFSDAAPGTIYWRNNGIMNLAFLEQNNTNLTVKIDHSIGDDEIANGLGAFITGEGNKFTVFLEASGIDNGYPTKTVEVHSGEITPDGIKNYQWILIMIDPAPTTIKRGEGRLWKDGDNISERVINSDNIVGVWKGRYSAGTVTLTINDDMTGVFDFVHNNGSKGSYKVSVNYADGKYNVVGTEWIDRPASFSMVNLNGGVISNGIFSGSNFDLWKVE